MDAIIVALIIVGIGLYFARQHWIGAVVIIVGAYMLYIAKGSNLEVYLFHLKDILALAITSGVFLWRQEKSIEKLSDLSENIVKMDTRLDTKLDMVIKNLKKE